MRARYFRFQSQTKCSLEITSAISVPNLVKIGEILRPPSLGRNKKISLQRKSVAAHWQRIHFLCRCKRYSKWEIYVGTRVKIGKKVDGVEIIDSLTLMRSERYRHACLVYAPTDIKGCPFPCIQRLDRQYKQRSCR